MPCSLCIYIYIYTGPSITIDGGGGVVEIACVVCLRHVLCFRSFCLFNLPSSLVVVVWFTVKGGSAVD